MNIHRKRMSSLEGVLNLKKATIADIPALLDLEKRVSETGTYSAMLEESEWKEELQNGTVYLIEKNGTAVGNISYEKKNNDNAYISGLVVDPHFQGSGIAREALSQVLNELRDFKRIELVVHPDNLIALNLYQSLGFTIESRKENYYGDGEPRLVMVLQR